MGGLGSGGWNGSGRPTVEQCARLSIAALRKRGALEIGARTVWSWSRGGEAFASINVHAAEDRLRLSYCASTDDGPARRVDEWVDFERAPCAFGGSRIFLCCPSCGARTLHLHLRRGRFACRSCVQLPYASQRERQRDRHSRAANKMRRLLGGEPGAFNPVPSRPKGMWRRTYARIVEDIARRETMVFEDLAGWIMAIGAKRRARSNGFW